MFPPANASPLRAGNKELFYEIDFGIPEVEGVLFPPFRSLDRALPTRTKLVASAFKHSGMLCRIASRMFLSQEVHSTSPEVTYLSYLGARGY